MDQPKTIRVLRHGSEVEIPEHEFNAATDTRLDGQTDADRDATTLGGAVSEASEAAAAAEASSEPAPPATSGAKAAKKK